MKAKRVFFLLFLFLLFMFGYSWQVYRAFPKRERLLSDKAYQGKLVFQKYHCIACHQLYGLGGFMGPDLTNVISRSGEAYVKTILQYGTARMPRLGLTQEEIEAVVAFLKAVDSSGRFPLKKDEYKIQWYGDYYLHY